MSMIGERILAWYKDNGRLTLPWRVVRNPYATLVSECMLQQTQVDRVVPKFTTFMQSYPDIFALARADRSDIIRQWIGLGYNSRAVRLHVVAQKIVSEFSGRIPEDEATLRSLPGIGPYTARAIMAFGYNRNVCATDTNIARIVHRVFYGLELPLKVKPATLDARAQELVVSGRAHDVNGALMDLGATVCTARNPNCNACPLAVDCTAAPIDHAALQKARRDVAAKGKPRIPFEQSARFARGRIVDRLRALPPGATISFLDLQADLDPILHPVLKADVLDFVERLRDDGLIRIDDRKHIALV
ncbi:MAG: HhH-GPD family protein [Vulcanimicrobiaceae bacterium]